MADTHLPAGKVDMKGGFLCNNMCLFCVQGDKRDRIGNFETGTILKRLEDAREYSDDIVFTGGEITIRKDFFRLVATAKKLHFRQIQIQSNGRMFSDLDFCQKTIDAGATEFLPALHGHTPELHDYLTRAPGSFLQTAKGIRNLKQLGQRILCNTVITRSNYRNLPEIARLLVHLNVDQFQLAFCHGLGSAADNFHSIIPRYSLIEPYVHTALDAGRAAGTTVMTEAIPFCFMQGYMEYVAEDIIPETRIYDNRVLESYSRYRTTEGKAKGEPCKECGMQERCEGPWIEYPEHYGWDEFSPLP